MYLPVSYTHLDVYKRQADPLEIINLCMIPALDSVGKGFEKGTIFLPQLLMSAEAAKAAFEVIKEAMEGSGQTQEKKGVIILATVKGDIHDIGKNIVKVLLENYSYEVVDLGRDVPPEKIAEETVKRRAPLVGLSALMTTTVPVSYTHLVAGGVGHNVGQLVIAALVVENRAVFYYLPFLLAAGSAAGAVIGMLGGIVTKRIGPAVRRLS